MPNLPDPRTILMPLSLAILCLSVVWMSTGCASLEPQHAETPPRLAPLTLTERCSPVRELPDAEFGTLYREYLWLVGEYRACRARHDGLAGWAERLSDED